MTFYRRGNLAPITPKGIHVLMRLREAKQNDWPFIHLPDVHVNVTRPLERKGWIFGSLGDDGIRFTITSAGLKALKVYEKPSRYYDGICPTCRTRPKMLRKSGKYFPYCNVCRLASNRRRSQLGIQRLIPGKPCANPKCSNVRYTSSKGRTYSRCLDCLNEQARRRATQRRARA